MDHNLRQSRYEYAYLPITPQFERATAKACVLAGRDYLHLNNTSPELTDLAREDIRGSTATFRHRLFLRWRQTLSSMPNITFPKRNGYLEIHTATHIIRLMKATYVAEPATDNPELYLRQHFPSNELTSELPISYYQPEFSGRFLLFANYVLREDFTISNFFFSDGRGKNVRSIKPLDLTPYSSLSSDEVRPAGDNPFSWRGNDDKGNKDENTG